MFPACSATSGPWIGSPSTSSDGEFFSMLGPSGSGKTTCLRLIAGFEQLTAGSIRIHGQEAANLPPYQRDVNTVFQDYALFPHMSDAGKRRLRPDGERRRQSRTPEARRRSAEHGCPGRLRRAQACAALRRPAAARRHGPRAGESAARPAAGRTPRRARSQAARADAGRAEEAAAPAGHHLYLRHPRSERSPVHVRPGGGVQ